MEVAEYSEVLNIPNDFLESDFRERCINIIPYPERIENGEWYDAYIYIWKRNLYNVILLIEILSTCFMLVGFHVFWSITEINKEIKGWGEGKERKFWDKNIFFLVRHGIEFQQKINKILTLTNDDTI